MKDLIKQVLRFGIVGGLAFLIDFITLYICTDFLGIYYLISSFISFSVSTIFNYIASVNWVFNVNEKNSKSKNFVFFVVFSIIGLIINQIIMWFSVEIIGLYYLLAKIISTVIVMIFNFITRKEFLE